MKRKNASLQVGKPVIVLNYILLILFCAFIIVPILTVLNTSFKTGEEYLNTSVFSLPKNPTFANYKAAFFDGGLVLAFWNTLILVVCGVLGSVALGLCSSFVLSRFRFKGRKLILNLFMFAVVIPYATIQVSIFPIIRGFGLYNTLGAGIVLYLATDLLQLYIFLQFMDKIPISLDESARVDGASYFTILVKIIIPQMVPAIVTVALIKGLQIYNDMLLQELYLSKLSLRTVSTALMKFSYMKNMQWTVLMASIILAMIPTLIIYLFAQKQIINGAMSGAVKG